VKTVKLFVEGGGDRKSLRTECRSGYNSFLQKAGLSGYMPRIVASGSRNAAYSDYCTAIKNGEDAVLLVDSESEVILPKDDHSIEVEYSKTWKPWYHLVNRLGQTGEVADSWEKPSGSSDEDCHMMVQSMESWFLADVATLKSYYGQRFRENSLPNRPDIESIPKDTVLSSLIAASRDTLKGSYDKGDHSFEILAKVNPDKVISQSPWARRFVTLLSEKMRILR